ncbi:MAG TPA: pyridoxamine 5'-phosphate oxidase family protein [Chloroflexota bacterium]
MSQPRTRLDTRFSDPDARPTDWEQTRQALEQAELFLVGTVRADGRPHMTPLVAVWLDDALYFSTGPTEQKAINLKSNPHVILTTGGDDWQHGLNIVVEGDAVQVTDERLLERLAAAWAKKWDGQWHFEVRDGAFWHADGGTALVFGVAPRKVLAFGKGPFSHTSHRF